MVFVTYGQVPGCPGYNNWLVFIGGVFACDFGKREDAERYASNWFQLGPIELDIREPHLRTM